MTKIQKIRDMVDEYIGDKDEFWYHDMLSEMNFEHGSTEVGYIKNYFKELTGAGIIFVSTVKGHKKKYLVK